MNKNWNFFVISNPKSQRYNNINHKDSIIFNGLWFDDDISEYYKDYNIPYNIKEHRKNATIALFQNHISLLRKIIWEDLHNTIILEDDTIYNKKQIINTLSKIEDLPEDILYLGGLFWGRLIKDKYVKINPEDRTKGIHKVKDYFRILGTQGYYIKNPEVAQKILNNIKRSNEKYYSHCIDACYSKMNIDKYYIQPSLVLHNCEYNSIIGNDGYLSNCNDL